MAYRIWKYKRLAVNFCLHRYYDLLDFTVPGRRRASRKRMQALQVLRAANDAMLEWQEQKYKELKPHYPQF